MVRALVLIGLALAGCGQEPPSRDRPPPPRREAPAPRTPPAVAQKAPPASVVDRTPDAAVAPPPDPAPAGPTGVAPPIPVGELPAPQALDAGFEPIDVPWATLDSLLVRTGAIGRGTRQSFRPLEARDWGERPVLPFAFRREAEPLVGAGYWHPVPRLSILLVPYRPLARNAGPNVALYALSPEGPRFIRNFEEHGLACASDLGLVEEVAIESGGAEVRRVYGCPGIGEEGTVEKLELEDGRLVVTIVPASFITH